MNALKWAGAPVTLKKHHKRLSDLCKVQDGFGSSIQCISLALSHIKKTYFSFRYSDRLTLKSLDAHLKGGGSVIVVHPNEIGLHVSLIINQTETGFLAVNAIAGKTIAEIPRNQVRLWVRSGANAAWFIAKIGTANK